MFPSAGYFRSANCPFFVHGLCHRPYCHFKHAKSEEKSVPKKPPVFKAPSITKSKLTLGVSRVGDGSGTSSTSPLSVEEKPSTSGVSAVPAKNIFETASEAAAKIRPVSPVEPKKSSVEKHVELNVKSSKLNEAESLLLSYCESNLDQESENKSNEKDTKEGINAYDKAPSSCCDEKENNLSKDEVGKETKCSEVIETNQNTVKSMNSDETGNSLSPAAAGGTECSEFGDVISAVETIRSDDEVYRTDVGETKNAQVWKKISKLKSATKRRKMQSGAGESRNASSESSEEDEMTQSEAACVKKNEKLIERLLKVLQEESEDLSDNLAQKVKKKLLKKGKLGGKMKEKEKEKPGKASKNNEGNEETTEEENEGRTVGKDEEKKKVKRLYSEEKIEEEKDENRTRTMKDSELKHTSSDGECSSHMNKKRNRTDSKEDEVEGVNGKKVVSTSKKERSKDNITDEEKLDKKKKVKSKDSLLKESKKKENTEMEYEDEHKGQKKQKQKELLNKEIIKTEDISEIGGTTLKDGKKNQTKDSLCKEKERKHGEVGSTIPVVMKQEEENTRKKEIIEGKREKSWDSLLVDYSLTDESDTEKGSENKVKKEKVKKLKEFSKKEKSSGYESGKTKSKVQLADIDFTKESKKTKEKLKGKEKSSSKEKEKKVVSKSGGLEKQKLKNNEKKSEKGNEKKSKEKEKLKKKKEGESNLKIVKNENKHLHSDSKGMSSDVVQRKSSGAVDERPSSSSSTNVSKKLKQTEESCEDSESESEWESDEDSFNNPDFADEEELLRIFNEASEKETSKTYGVQQNELPALIHPRPAVVKRSSSADSSVNNIPAKKIRIAHEPKYLVQRVSSSLSTSPQKRIPKTLSREVTSTTSSLPSSSSGEGSLHLGKKRIAHSGKSNSPGFSIMVRPKIALEYGAKVPQNIRQRYLDKIIDEYLVMFGSEQQAYIKAVEEEKNIYSRSTRRQLYMNLCTHLIKRLRESVINPSPAGAATATEPSTSSPVSPDKRNPLAPKRFFLSPPKVAKSSPLEITETDETVKEDIAMESPTKTKNDNPSEDEFYEGLRQYLLSEDDLIENGYPRSSDAPGKASIKRTIHSKKSSRPNSDPTRRTCARCGKPFVILEGGEYLLKEECSYHWGRLWKRRVAGEIISSYSCCQGDAGSNGCCVSKVHVPENVENDVGYMTTIFNPVANTKSKKVYSLDCEMCYTVKGLELTRVTVVDYNLQAIYDTFVKPDQPIVDYNTRFSGITEENMCDVTTTLREVQAVLLSFIHRDTVLIGHSLESDLIALKLIHSRVVDTAVVFPHRLGPPYKRALRNLMGEYLHKIIQDSVAGHDSFEDASSCIELMLWKIKDDLKKKGRNRR